MQFLLVLGCPQIKEIYFVAGKLEEYVKTVEKWSKR